ncbi:MULTISPECIES: hypothetical protein [Kitasatospora]|uniref:ATPase n=1 Tax=Kitasatospora cathayae TaxID=3004092 RepID=A0ABY7PW93_9ACTN|nr:hypothetical protein [Kitasatospora sp. HUAS 3-15]WBP84641.1 hypothetical protein O1G21_01425 [Kitasatospora sp. HUAS 3-15]
MARFRDFLARFRPAGTPGAPTVGVPADRAAELAAELEQPLGGLAQAQAEAAAIRAEAAAEAERIRQEAVRNAERIVELAHARALRVRAEAAAVAGHAASARAAELAADAEQAADRIRSRARERMPALADRAAALALEPADDPGRHRWQQAGSAE